jgi:hypothetical protein
MKRARPRMVSVVRSLSLLSLLGGTMGGLSGLPSCIIAEGSPPLPAVPNVRPTIVRSSTIPRSDRVLVSLPDEFIVGVEMVNVDESFDWKLFLDYEAADLTSEPIRRGTDLGRGRARQIRVQVAPETAPDKALCHVFELVVAKQFRSTDGISVRTPLGGADADLGEPLSDSVLWYYSPSGDLRGCPVYEGMVSPRDAGVSGDAAREAGGETGAGQ